MIIFKTCSLIWELKNLANSDEKIEYTLDAYKEEAKIRWAVLAKDDYSRNGYDWYLDENTAAKDKTSVIYTF